MVYRKYKNVKVTYDSFSFSSKLEAAVYTILKARENGGEISDIKTQQTVYLTEARISFIPDFSFTHNESGELIYAEAKGVETASYRIKRKLWTYYGPGILEVYKGSHTRPYLDETIVPKLSVK